MGEGSGEIFSDMYRHVSFFDAGVLAQGVQTEEEEDLVITLEGISTSILAQLTGRFYRWLGKKLPLGADVRAIQVGRRMTLGTTSFIMLCKYSFSMLR